MRCRHSPRAKALARRRAAETDDVPADDTRHSARGRCAACSWRSAPSNTMVSCGSHSSEASAADASVHGLRGAPAAGAIPLRRARRRELRVRTRTDVDVEFEPVAADDAARRMHDDALADVRTFRVQRLLHDERSRVRRAGRARVRRRIAFEAERQARVPARGGGFGGHRRHAHGSGWCHARSRCARHADHAHAPARANTRRALPARRRSRTTASSA